MLAFIEGVGLVGPSLQGWQASRSVLAGAEPYRYAPTALATTELLPPAERRRAGVPVKLALAAGQEAFRGAACDAADMATESFGSAGSNEGT